MRAPAEIHAFACTLAGAPASLRSLLGSLLVDDAETGTLRVSGSLHTLDDEYETVDAALRVRTIGERQVVERTPVDGYVLPDAHGLSAKLEQLREAIAQAGGYDFVTVQGQRMLR